MSKTIEAAVAAALGREHIARISLQDVQEADRAITWVEVVYRDLAQGPGADGLRAVMDTVDTPDAVVSFVAEDDLLAMAAE